MVLLFLMFIIDEILRVMSNVDYKYVINCVLGFIWEMLIFL